MRTLIIVVIGVLIGCALVFALRKNPSALRTAVRGFLALWFVATAYNLWIGMTHGYSFMAEIPFFLANFGVPALFVYLLARRFGGARARR